jgi:hypothetical protein
MQRTDSGWFCAASVIDDERCPQVQRQRRLALVEAELRKVVVHVRDRAGRGLLALLGGRALHLLDHFLFREELTIDSLRPLERRVRGVVPEALEVRMSIGQTRNFVRWRAFPPCLCLRPHRHDNYERARESREGHCDKKSTQHVLSV